MHIRSMLLILVACAVLGGAVGGWAYVNRTPRIFLCAMSGPVGTTPQQIADAEASREQAAQACQANADRMNAEATRFDPVGFGFWAGVGAVAVVLVGWLVTFAYRERRPRQSLRGRGW